MNVHFPTFPVTKTETHETRIVGSIGHDDLKKIILAAVCDNANIPQYASGLEITLLALAPTEDEQIGLGLHFELVQDHDYPDTTTPSRRSIIRRIATAPIAGYVVAETVKPTPISNEERAVLAHAERATRLIAEQQAAWDRFERLDDEHEARLPAKPCHLDKQAMTALCMKVLLTFPEVTPEVDQALTAMRRATEQKIDAARAAWDKENARLAAALGLEAAEDAHRKVSDQVVTAVVALADLQATTLAAVAAKAKVCARIPCGEIENHHWRLTKSVIDDLASL